jgi:hypothetical protein
LKAHLFETVIKTSGLTGYHLKLLGIILMTLDHAYQLFHGQYHIPRWFSLLGRMAAPIFLFLCAESFARTQHKKRYILRLLIFAEGMCLISTGLLFAMPTHTPLNNNIFETLFIATLYMLFADMFCKGVRQKHPAQIVKAMLLALAPVALYFLTLCILAALSQLGCPDWLALALMKIVPNPIVTEGGIPAVSLGVLFYVFKNHRRLQFLTLAAISAFLSFVAPDRGLWCMLLAALPLSCYNGVRGRYNKYFFYFFYPAHLCLLYAIAYLSELMS